MRSLDDRFKDHAHRPSDAQRVLADAATQLAQLESIASQCDDADQARVPELKAMYATATQALEKLRPKFKSLDETLSGIKARVGEKSRTAYLQDYSKQKMDLETKLEAGGFCKNFAKAFASAAHALDSEVRPTKAPEVFDAVQKLVQLKPEALDFSSQSPAFFDNEHSVSQFLAGVAGSALEKEPDLAKTAEKELQEKQKCPGCFGKLPTTAITEWSWADLKSQHIDKASLVSAKLFRQREGLKGVPFPGVGALVFAMRSTWWLVCFRMSRLLKEGVVMGCFGAFLEQPSLQKFAKTGDMVMKKLMPGESFVVPWGWNVVMCLIGNENVASASASPKRSKDDKKSDAELVGHAIHCPLFDKAMVGALPAEVVTGFDTPMVDLFKKMAPKHAYSAECLDTWTAFKATLGGGD